jgi:hypothetical protein
LFSETRSSVPLLRSRRWRERRRAATIGIGRERHGHVGQADARDVVVERTLFSVDYPYEQIELSNSARPISYAANITILAVTLGIGPIFKAFCSICPYDE